MDIQKFKAALGDPSESQQELDKYSNKAYDGKSEKDITKESNGELDEESNEELNNDSNKEFNERYDLLDRYGLKEMDIKDVDELLGAYDNGLDNKELENMERILSKKIYQAIMSITDIKKVAVEVFMENSDGLYGTVTIIVEYAPKGFLDRILGTSNSSRVNVKIIEIIQDEIIEIFGDHPEVVENFEIKVESF